MTRKRETAVLIIAAAIATGLLAVLAAPADSHISEAADRPVKIATLPCGGARQSTSSGFVIADETVVTVAHAIYGSRDLAVRTSDGVWRSARVRHLDLDRDLAVLNVDGADATQWSSARADSDDPIVLLGGAASGTTSGSVIRRVRISTEAIGSNDLFRRSGYELALGISLGDSGGAIVNVDDELVGVVFSRSTTRDSVTWATSAAELELTTSRDEVPTWDCPAGPDTKLDLSPADGITRREPAQLAG